MTGIDYYNAGYADHGYYNEGAGYSLEADMTAQLLQEQEQMRIAQEQAALETARAEQEAPEAQQQALAVQQEAQQVEAQSNDLVSVMGNGEFTTEIRQSVDAAMQDSGLDLAGGVEDLGQATPARQMAEVIRREIYTSLSNDDIAQLQNGNDEDKWVVIDNAVSMATDLTQSILGDGGQVVLQGLVNSTKEDFGVAGLESYIVKAATPEDKGVLAGLMDRIVPDKANAKSESIDVGSAIASIGDTTGTLANAFVPDKTASKSASFDVGSAIASIGNTTGAVANAIVPDKTASKSGSINIGSSLGAIANIPQNIIDSWSGVLALLPNIGGSSITDANPNTSPISAEPVENADA